MKKENLLKIAILMTLVAALVFLFVHFGLYDFFIYKDKAIAFINSFGPLSVLIFISLQIFQVVAAPIPGEATGFIGGYLYGPLLGTLYSTVGLAIGSWLAFVLARTYGLPLVEKVINKELVAKYDYFLRHKGIAVSFILFLVPGFPKDSLCYVMGLSHMETRTFVIVSTVGRLLGTILLSLGGSFVRNDQTEELIVLGIIGGLLILVAYLRRESWLKYFHRNH